MFEQQGLEVKALSGLPESKEDLYALLLEKKADFLLIDHELNKKVNYNGYEALQSIRNQDSTLYAVLLTNFRVDDFKNEFGIYDMEVYKGDTAVINAIERGIPAARSGLFILMVLIGASIISAFVHAISAYVFRKINLR